MSRWPSGLARLMASREFGLLCLIAGITCVVAAVDVNFLDWGNLKDLLVRCAPTTIVACGVMLIVVTGEIDISVGSLMALLAAVMGLMLSQHHAGWPLALGVPLTLLLGTCIGGLTGILVTVGRIPSIIVTLGLLTALRGATTLMMGGENIDGLPSQLGSWTKEGFAGLPLGIWVAVLVVLATGWLMRRTAWGWRLFAIGSSPYAARMCGLQAARLKLSVFALTGFLTAVATVVDVPRLPKIEAGIGNGFELLVVTCVVVGGVSIRGGRGTLPGVLLAVLLMTLVRPSLTFLDVGEAGEKWTKAIQGLFILLAIISDHLVSQWSGRTGMPFYLRRRQT